MMPSQTTTRAAWRKIGMILLLAAALTEVVTAQETPTPEGAKPSTSSLVFVYERTLRDAKIETDTAGIKAYLLSLLPSPETKGRLDKLIAQLGATEYSEREAAMTELRQRSAIAMDALRAATKHENPEIAWRSKKLLDNAISEADVTLFAIFKTVELRQFKGLAAPILVTLPLCGKDFVRFASRRALAATATPNDRALLQQELQNQDANIRIAALGALAALDERAAGDDALTLANDRDATVRMAVGKLLAQQGRREALPLLVALLDADAVEVRGDAHRTLRVVTAQDFGFVPYDAPADRAGARDKWKEWVASSGATARLVPFAKDAPFEYGRILVCSYAQNKVFEFDADAKDASKPRWEVQIDKQPWAVQGLPDGRRLVACYGGRKVYEFGPENDAQKPLWESETLPGGPMGVERLDNGNTLVACTDAMLIAELDPQGKVVKKWTIAGRPVDVQRLENGNMLVTLQNGPKVVELDGDGKVQWSTKVELLNPFSAQRLENGNTLVASLSAGKVVEVNRAGDEVVWSVTGLSNPYHARRISSGNTLVVDEKGVYEYETLSKKVVWKLEIPNVSRASRF